MSAFTWYKIIVSAISWKGIEAYSLQFMEIKDIKLDQLANDYISKINAEFKKVVDLMEAICSTAPDPPKETDISLVVNPSNRSPLMLSRQNNSNIQAKQAQDNLIKYVGGSKHAGQANQSQLINEEAFDFSFLYLCKYSLNYVFDMYLTVNIFNSLRASKINKDISTFDFKQMTQYLINYLTMLQKQKNFKIESSYDKYDEIEANYEYVRVLMFNMLLFILNNSEDDKNKKILEVKFKHDKFIPNSPSIFRVNFIFTDQKPIIKYNQLKEVFHKMKNCEIKDLNPEIFKILDIGIIICYYITTYIYNSEFTIYQGKDSRVSMSVFFYAENKTKKGSSTDLKKLNVDRKKTISNIEDEIVNKFMLKLHNIKIVDNDETAKANKGDNDIEDSDSSSYVEDENETLEQDRKKYESLKSEISKNDFSLWDLTVPKPMLEVSKSNSSIIKKHIGETKSDSPRTPNSKKLQFYWKIKEIIQLFPKPIFLIVEDNWYGRVNIKDSIRKINPNFIIDSAEDGVIAIERFSRLYKKGYIYDMIFMDINLPQMNGDKAAWHIREIENSHPNIRTKIIAVTVEENYAMDTTLFDYFCKQT